MSDGFEEAAATFVEQLPLSWLDDLLGLKGVEGPEGSQSTVAELRERVASLEAENGRLSADLDRYQQALIRNLQQEVELDRANAQEREDDAHLDEVSERS